MRNSLDTEFYIYENLERNILEEFLWLLEIIYKYFNLEISNKLTAQQFFDCKKYRTNFSLDILYFKQLFKKERGVPRSKPC